MCLILSEFFMSCSSRPKPRLLRASCLALAKFFVAGPKILGRMATITCCLAGDEGMTSNFQASVPKRVKRETDQNVYEFKPRVTRRTAGMTYVFPPNMSGANEIRVYYLKYKSRRASHTSTGRLSTIYRANFVSHTSILTRRSARLLQERTAHG